MPNDPHTINQILTALQGHAHRKQPAALSAEDVQRLTRYLAHLSDYTTPAQRSAAQAMADEFSEEIL